MDAIEFRLCKFICAHVCNSAKQMLCLQCLYINSFLSTSFQAKLQLWLILSLLTPTAGFFSVFMYACGPILLKWWIQRDNWIQHLNPFVARSVIIVNTASIFQINDKTKTRVTQSLIFCFSYRCAIQTIIYINLFLKVFFRNCLKQLSPQTCLQLFLTFGWLVGHDL